jgi:tetratricopeptide (TPR) repeat protein
MIKTKRHVLALALSIGLSTVLLTGCSGKQERQEKYLQRAQEYFSAGNYDKARIEARNVLQINANNAEARYVLAEIAEKESNWQQLFSELNAALENDPKLLKARVKLAQMFVLSNQLDKAVEQAAKIKEQDANSPDLYLVTAAIAAREQKMDEAIENAQKALAIKPGHVGATELLASVYTDSDPVKAEQIIAEGIRINPDEEDLLLLKAQIYANHKKVDETIATLKELIKRHPDKLAYVSNLVQFYVGQNRIADGESLIKQTIKDKPDNVDLKLAYVDFIAKQQRQEDAMALLTDYVKAEPANYKLRSALARRYVQANAPDKAIATYQYTIDKDVKGEGIEARNRVIEILLGQNKRTEAEAMLKDVFKLEPESIDALLIRARLEMIDNNTDAAIADLRGVLKNSPDSPQALLLLAAAQERTGATSLALDSYKKALQTNSDNSLALLGAARLSLADNQLDDAKKYLEHTHALDGSNAEASRLLVNLYAHNQQWQLAFDLCEQLIQDKNNAPIGYYLKGLVLIEKKDSAAAIDSMKKSLDMEPRAIEPLQALISIYASTRQANAATTYLEAHVKAHPDQIHAKELLGAVYRQTGKLEQARAILSDVINLQPSRISAYRELSAVYSMQKQPEKMATLLENGLQKNPESIDLMLFQAQHYESIGQYKDTQALYEKALRLQPKANVIKNNLALLLMEKFPTEENLRRAQTLTEDFANSKSPIFVDTLAWLQYKLKNYPQSISLLESVLNKNLDAPELRYHLGMAYLKNGQLDKAKVELTKATVDKTTYSGREEAEAELKKL